MYINLKIIMIHEITPVPKGQKLYDSTYMKYPEKSNSKKRKENVVARG